MKRKPLKNAMSPLKKIMLMAYDVEYRTPHISCRFVVIYNRKKRSIHNEFRLMFRTPLGLFAGTTQTYN